MIRVILPAYNEEAALPLLIPALHHALHDYDPQYQVIVVDDGSADRTAEVASHAAAEYPVRLVQHERNRGLGAALQTGLLEGLREAAATDILVTLDADNTHPAELIPAMAELIRSGLDIVIASRYAPGGRQVGLSWQRRSLSRGASLLLRAALALPGARDYTCGFRAYTAGIVRRGQETFGEQLIEEQGFVCMVELLAKLGFLGARIGEVPLVLRYDLKQGPSKMKIARTVMAYFRLLRRRSALRRPQP